MFSFEQLEHTYDPLWQGLEIRPECLHETTKEAQLVLGNKTRYQGIEKSTGVPWFCIGIIHLREAGDRDQHEFRCVLHNGERIVGTGQRTHLVPAGKGPFSTFEEAAEDALRGYGGLTWSIQRLAYTLEKFNGFGYRSHGIPSPYLWGGTNHQKRGKYVRDGQYDPNVMDPQNGGMAVLLELMRLAPTAVNFQLVDVHAKAGVTPGAFNENHPTWWGSVASEINHIVHTI